MNEFLKAKIGRDLHIALGLIHNFDSWDLQTQNQHCTKNWHSLTADKTLIKGSLLKTCFKDCNTLTLSGAT